MNEELIVIRQLPVIEEQLKMVQEGVKSRVADVLSLACTEDTYREVKRARSVLNKEYAELEQRRKEVKKSILAPYEQFERVYKECAGDIYTAADATLKQRIGEVEDGLKAKKAAEVETYFDEYRDSLGIASDLADYAHAGIKVNLSDSTKSLKDRAKTFLDGVAGDLAMIETQEHREEILVEYRKTLDAARAITTVTERHRAIEQARARQEEAAARRASVEKTVEIVEEAAALSVPIAEPVAEVREAPAPEKVYATEFRVHGTLDALKALKQFLDDGGYQYEQL